MSSDYNSRPFRGYPARLEYDHQPFSTSATKPYGHEAMSRAAQRQRQQQHQHQHQQQRDRQEYAHPHPQGRVELPSQSHTADSQIIAPVPHARTRSRAFSFDRLGLSHVPLYQELNANAGTAMTTNYDRYQLEHRPNRRGSLYTQSTEFQGYPAMYSDHLRYQASQIQSADHLQSYLQRQQQQQQQLHQYSQASRPSASMYATPYYNESAQERGQRSRSSTLNYTGRNPSDVDDFARGRSGSNVSKASTTKPSNGPEMNIIPATPPKEKIIMGTAGIPIHSPPMPTALWSQMRMLQSHSSLASTPRLQEEWEKELWGKMDKEAAARANGQSKVKSELRASKSAIELGSLNKDTLVDEPLDNFSETISAFALSKTSTDYNVSAGLFSLGLNTIWSPVNAIEKQRAVSPIHRIEEARKSRNSTPRVPQQERALESAQETSEEAAQEAAMPTIRLNDNTPTIRIQESETTPDYFSRRGSNDSNLSTKKPEIIERNPSPFDTTAISRGLDYITRSSSLLDVRYPTPLSSASSNLTGSSASSSIYPEMTPPLRDKENNIIPHKSGYTPFDPYSDSNIANPQKLAFKRAKHWPVARQSLDKARHRIRKIVLGKKLFASDEHISYISDRSIAIVDLEILIAEGHPELARDAQITDISVMKLCNDMGHIAGAGCQMRILVLDACPFVSDASFAEVVGNCPLLEYLRVSAGGGSEHGGVKMRGRITDQSILLLHGRDDLAKRLKELVLYDQGVRKDTARALTAVRKGVAVRIGCGVVKKGSERAIYWRSQRPHGEPDYKEVSTYWNGEEIHWDVGDDGM